MSASLGELLQPQIVTEMVSLLKPGRGQLGSWLGFHPTMFDANTVQVSGPNTLTTGTTVRDLTYRIFNDTRVPTPFRSPGVGPATTAANPMGQNTVRIGRAHSKIVLNYELLGNMSAMMGPNSQIDAGGQAYIGQQQEYLVKQGHECVEIMAVGMMRDSLYLINTGGDDWRASFTAPSNPTTFGYQVDFKVPAGNKSQLNMLGSGDIIGTTWSNSAAPIIGDINQVIAAYAQLSRYQMTDIFINSSMWINIISNTEVRNVAGSANTPFASLSYDERAAVNNGPPMRTAVIRGAPDVRFHMIDDTFSLGADTDPVNTSSGGNTGTLTKHIPDTMALFTTSPDAGNWCKLYYGGEYVAEAPGAAPMPRMGWYSWSMTVVQPTALELICLLNAIPALYVPTVVAPGTVIFP